MSINARVRKTKRKYGVSYGFEILENYRNKAKLGQPDNRRLAGLGTIKENFLAVPVVQYKFWQKVDLTLNKLIKSGKISEGDRGKIEKRFAEFISRPSAGAIATPKPKPKSSPAMATR